MKLQIDVTQEDIDKGIKKDCEKCPIALATLRAIPFLKRIGVTQYWISFYIPALNTIHYDTNTSYRVLQFIEKFDSRINQKPLPFSFELDVPKEWIKYCEE